MPNDSAQPNDPASNEAVSPEAFSPETGASEKWANIFAAGFPAEMPVTISDCAQATGGLQFFLDGALGGQQQRSMQTHLDECPPCFDALQFQTGIRSMLQRECRAEPPPGLRDRVFGRILSDDFGDGFGPDSGPGL